MTWNTHLEDLVREIWWLGSVSLLAGTLALLCPGDVQAQVVPLGPKQTLSSPPDACFQIEPTLAAQPGGEVLAAWTDLFEDRHLVRMVESGGTLGEPVEAFSDISGHVRIATLPGGDAVALTHPGTNEGGVWVEQLTLSLLDASSLPISQAIVSDEGHFLDFALATGPDGLVVAWQRDTTPGPSDDPVILVRRFGADLLPRPGLVMLDGDLERYPALIQLDDGRSLVAFGEAESESQIRLQLMDGDGFAIGTPTPGPVGRWPRLAARDGIVALTWVVPSAAPGDKVRVQLWDPDGMVPLGLEIAIDDAPATEVPIVLPTGVGWLAAWVSNGEVGGDRGVLYARLLDPSANPLGPSSALNDPLTDDYGDFAGLVSPDLVLVGNRLIAAWQVYTDTVIIPTPCNVSEALETRQFLIGPSLAEVPALGTAGLVGLAALLMALAWRRLGA